MSKQSLYVIDGHNVLYRAHFAFQSNPLINSQKRDVSVAFGFTRMLLSLMNDRKPEFMAIAFDRKAPTFRHELYKQYKLTRPPMPAPIADNLPDIQRIIRAMGIRIIEQDGYEADDLLGSIVRMVQSMPVHVYLVSKDKDMLQLVSDNVSVLSTRQGLSDLMEFTQAEVIAKYGIGPDQMLDYFSMIGDAVDNIPGIGGVGPKTAVKLIAEYGSLEQLYAHADEIKGKIGEKIRNDKSIAFLSRELISLRYDADLPDQLEDYRIQEMNKEGLYELLKELEFNSLIHTLNLETRAADAPLRKYSIVTRRDHLAMIARDIRELRHVAIDTETTGLDPLTARLVGISLSYRDHEAVYIPVGHETLEPQARLDDVREVLLPVLRDPTIVKIGQNTKYDRHILDRVDIPIDAPWFDTMLADYVLDAGRRKHNLDLLTEVYLSEGKIPTEDIIGKGAKATTMDKVPIAKVSEYACEDADVTRRLFPVLSTRLREMEMEHLFSTIEMPLTDVLRGMEKEGIGLDIPLLKKLGKELHESIALLEDDIWCMAGTRFNINSPKQLADVLFDRLGFPSSGIRKTKSGMSTAESELRKLASTGGLFRELPERILEYRTLAKLLGTYIEPLPDMINPETGRLHTQFNQTGTETGRLSSSDPNLQNIPIRTNIGKQIRKAFIPREGNVMISADYSQMELRILAHVAEDEAMIDAFRQGQDIHAATASQIFNVPLDAVTADQRRRAKTINFGIDYGMTPFGLSERLGLSVEDARQMIESYLNRFRGVRRYIDETKERVAREGWVATLLGRRRPIPMAREANRNLREMGFRQAINMRIQGTAADIIKIAMIRIYESFRKNGIHSRMVLQIHDELLFDVERDEIQVVTDLVRRIMEQAYTLCVPLTVDVNQGPNWAEAH
ncbi:DNA polymerase I [bacterium]|nr:DNA polymerase I [candidate division CSSED10-310 bacterium]